MQHGEWDVTGGKELEAIYLLGGLTHQHEALSVGNDLRRVQRLLEVINELLLVTLEWLLLWSRDDLARSCTLGLDSGQAASEDGLTNKRDCDIAISDRLSDAHAKGANNAPGIPASRAATAVHLPVPF